MLRSLGSRKKNEHGFFMTGSKGVVVAAFVSNAESMKQVLGTSTSTNLASRDCAHDKERLRAFHDRVGKGSVWRFVRDIFAASEEAHERTTL